MKHLIIFIFFATAAHQSFAATPVLQNVTPTNGSRDVPVDASFTISYDINIQAGTGNFIVRRLSDDAIVSTIPASSGTINISAITFTPAGLQLNTEYYIELTTDLVTDGTDGSVEQLGNSFWTFTTTRLPIVSNASGINVDNDGDVVNVQSDELGDVYIVLSSLSISNETDLISAVTLNQGATNTVGAINTDVPISTNNIEFSGSYLAYAVDPAGNVSNPGSNSITVNDVTVPIVSNTMQSAGNGPATNVQVQSDEPSGFVYIVEENVPQSTLTDLDNAIAANNGARAAVTAANTPIDVSTTGLNVAIYFAYAVDAAGNISARGSNAITITDGINPEITGTSPADNATNVTHTLNTLEVTFDENIQLRAGTVDNNNDRVRIMINNTEVLAIGKNLLDFTNSPTVVIPLGAFSFTPGESYNVRIGNDVMEDIAGNNFQGINNQTGWNFSIEPPPAILSAANSTCVGSTYMITGSNFGSSEPTVTFGGLPAPINSHSPSSIEIVVPALTPGNHTFTITNNDNTLSVTSGNINVKAQIDVGLPVAADPVTVLLNASSTISVQNTQNGVQYTLRRTSPSPGDIPPTNVNGNGGELQFSTGNLVAEGIYEYQIRASSANCDSRFLTQTVSVAAIDLSADAGADRTICEGDTVTLGGSPAGQGGTGFLRYSWSANVPGQITPANTELPNPRVWPDVSATYTLTVEDSDGVMITDDVVITVNERPDSALIDIIFTPNDNNFNYNNNSDPVSLSYTYNGVFDFYPNGSNFTGPGVNSAENIFYPTVAGEGPHEILFTYVGANGCTAIKPTRVVVSDPDEFFVDLNATHCVNGGNDSFIVGDLPEENFERFGLYWVPTYTYSGTEVRNLSNQVFPTALSGSGFNRTFIPSALTPGDYRIVNIYNATYDIYLDASLTFLVLDDYNQGPEIRSKELVINDIPSLELNFSREFCRNIGSDPEITVFPVGGTYDFNNNGVSGLNFSGGSTFLDLNDLANVNDGVNTLEYTYTNPTTGCSNTETFNLTVFPFPTTDFDISSADGFCINTPITFTPNVNTNGSVINRYLWDYGDGTAIDERADDSQFDYIYPIERSYTIRLLTETDNGCQVSHEETIDIGNFPNLSFTWRNVCEDEPTMFFASSTTTAGLLDSIAWDFGNGNRTRRNIDASADLTQPFQNQYTPGQYDVTARLTTELGCATTVNQEVYTVPVVGGITAENIFVDDFDVDRGWVPGGINYSWELGNPSGSFIDTDANGGGSAWVTNLSGAYNEGERSWIHSPCFDLSNLDRPVIRFDLRVLSRPVDGLVLQYNTTNETEFDDNNANNSWRTIGEPETGLNWYNNSGIVSNPGDQLINQYGWSGPIDTTTWRTASFAIDPLQGETEVRFRFAFTSLDRSLSLPEGMAIDNFTIATRDHITLLEHFTNIGESNSEKADVNQFVASRSLSEVIKIQYHPGFQNDEDQNYLVNPIDADARAAYYGLTNVPFSFVDGNRNSGPFSAWGEELYNQRALEVSDAIIDHITIEAEPLGFLNIATSITAREDLPANTVLHVVVVERVVNSEETEFFVMRKMLPNAAGTKFNEVLPATQSRDFNVSWAIPPQIDDDLAVIVFVQNELTKEILQASIIENPQIPEAGDRITSIEEDYNKDLLIYPNPSSGRVNMILPNSHTDGDILIYDNVGKLVYSATVPADQKIHSITMNNISSGIYSVIFRDTENDVIHKKLIISR